MVKRGAVKGGRGRCRGIHGREGWVRDIYGGDEGRINIRGREGWVGERYEGGQIKRKGIVGREINISGREGLGVLDMSRDETSTLCPK